MKKKKHACISDSLPTTDLPLFCFLQQFLGKDEQHNTTNWGRWEDSFYEHYGGQWDMRQLPTEACALIQA